MRVECDGGRFYVDRTFHPLALEAEQVRRHAQDLAYIAEAVGRVLEPYDDWRALVELQTSDLNRWTVSFATPEQAIVTALIDLKAGRVLEVETP